MNGWIDGWMDVGFIVPLDQPGNLASFTPAQKTVHPVNLSTQILVNQPC